MMLATYGGYYSATTLGGTFGSGGLETAAVWSMAGGGHRDGGARRGALTEARAALLIVMPPPVAGLPFGATRTLQATSRPGPGPRAHQAGSG